MITDGNQTTTLPYTRLSVASRGIKNKGVTVYALGVGRGAYRAELEEIASGSEYVFTSSSFRDLQNIAPRITKQFCAGKNADYARFRLLRFLDRLPVLKDVRANCCCASLLRTQIRMPRYASSAHSKY